MALNLEQTAFYKAQNATEDAKKKAESLVKTNAAYYNYLGAKNTAKYDVDMLTIELNNIKDKAEIEKASYNTLKTPLAGQSVEAYLYNVSKAGELAEAIDKTLENPTKKLQKAELKLKAIIELGVANGFEEAV